MAIENVMDGSGTRAAGLLVADLIGLSGAGLQVTEFGKVEPAERTGVGAVRVGVHRNGAIPTGGLEGFDILLSTHPETSRAWVTVREEEMDAVVAGLLSAVEAQPTAAAVAAQVVRMSPQLSFDDALALESLAYSMLLASSGFQTWRRARPRRDRRDDAPRVLLSQEDGTLDIRLNRPDARNAFDARMRDELAEALGFALEHPDAPSVTLSAAGPAFSAGGDLDEFGRATDPGLAHLIRTLRSPARLARELGERLTVRFHGACVGAGIEAPAAAARVTARRGTTFRLPEISMGLIPGAGGTATIPRRIGRWRACYMAISGVEIDLTTGLTWGLVDAVEA